FDLIRTEQTMGLFQIESSGMKKAIKILQPNCFEDIVALLALFRPGPMDSIQSYARRKAGKEKINYYSDSLKPILEETYGIIVYQEQVNSITRVMAGFSMGEADLFRRAISKKKVAEMVKMKEDFVKGALKNGYDQKTIDAVYDLILRFANYGFNKSHAVVYAIICCRMAYLKHKYPLEFYSAILQSTSATNDTKFSLYVSEMKKRGLSVLQPNVNTSTYRFEITDKGLVYPLTGIHGVNEQFTLKIMEERKANGPYKDFFDFIIRMYQYKVTDTQLQSLIDAGAMDSFSTSRESMRMSVRKGLQYSELITDANGQLTLGIPMYDYPSLIDQHDDPIENLNKEYSAIGIMLSDSPLAYKKDLLQTHGVTDISSVSTDVNANYKICGIIREIKTHTTKKKQTMAFLKVFDESGEIEVTVFADAYQDAISCLKKNNIIVIEGSNRVRNQDNDFIASKIYLLEEEENDA
ncbi:MAG: OB-fold nucleic acid binding domain-containing protein, partial [Bacilli bacterium]|nr:OB-fold nucleic acid binding domain-containing protein [Bacilli bacterium]